MLCVCINSSYYFMENYQSIEQVLQGLDSSIVYKSKKSPVLSILFIAIGVLSFVLNSIYQAEPTSFIPPALIVSGAIFVLYGVISLVFRKSYFVSARSGKKLKKHEIYFDASERDKLIKIMQNGHPEALKTLKRSASDGLKLRVLTADDAAFGFSQIVAFVPYEFVNVTEPRQHEQLQVKALLDVLVQMN